MNGCRMRGDCGFTSEEQVRDGRGDEIVIARSGFSCNVRVRSL